MTTPGRARASGVPTTLRLAALVGAALAIVPIVYLVDRIVGSGWESTRHELTRAGLLSLTFRSVGLAAVVGTACAVVGTATAWLVEATDLPARRAWHVALTLPLAVPSYVAAYSWVSWLPGLRGFWGAALVLTLVSFPLVHLSVAAGFRQLDASVVEVSRSLGRGPRQVVGQVLVRQLRPNISAGVLLVVLYVLSDFGVVATMRYDAFTWVIYGAYRAGFNPNRAAVLSMVLVIASIAIVTAELWVRGRAASRVGGGTHRSLVPARLGGWRWPALALAGGLVGAAIGVPVVRALQWMARGLEIGVPWDDFASAAWTTLRLATSAAALCTAFAIPVGVLAARDRRRSSAWIERSVFVAHSLPGIVIAISFVFVGVRLLRPIYLETPLLLIAYTALLLSLAVGAVRVAVEHVPPGLEESARTLGRRPYAVLGRVTLPLAAPGIAAGAALVLLTAARELPTTLILRPTGTETLATELWRYSVVSDRAAVGPYALALIAVSVLPALWLSARSPIPDRRETL